MTSIAALLSGGVDSAVALAKYIEEFPQHKQFITAYYLKIWLEDELSFLGSCPWEEDLSFARAVAEQLEVPLEVISLQREYYDRVVSYTIEELKMGGTPSPDIFCNERIKFGAFLEKVTGVERTVSGHYAQLIYSDTEGSRLFRSPDPVKDQTYFLSHLSQRQLAGIYFPLGYLEKPEVRSYAQSVQLAPQNRKDSQGICFLGKIKYRDFVKYHLGTREGKIVDTHSGKTMGTHDGSWFYTIGQRNGLGLGGGPWYVSKKEFDDNIVWISHGDYMQDEEKSIIHVEQIHWIHEPSIQSGNYSARTNANTIGATKDARNSIDINAQSINQVNLDNLLVKVRHGKDILPATLQYNITTKTGTINLAKGDRGIAMGQFVVLYMDQECLGCARINGAS